MRTEHKNPQLNCQKLAEVFLSNPLIEDCYFMVREGELVAYIVSSQMGILNNCPPIYSLSYRTIFYLISMCRFPVYP